MSNVLWLSREDVRATGVCDLAETIKIVEKAFRLFDDKQALIVQEAALRLGGDGLDQACYTLPAYVGGAFNVCGLKWSAHGPAVDPADMNQSRIQATVVINQADQGIPLAVMNGTEIGAARTGAVSAAALKRLAPADCRKVALCGAGGQARRQLEAVLLALPQVEEVAIWSRGNERNRRLAEAYQGTTSVRLTPCAEVDEAVAGADVIIGATSAPEPYLTPERLKDASLYCHIGFNEISGDGVDQFRHIVVDTWEEAKEVSGQSLFRLYREGRVAESRISATLGAIIAGRVAAPQASRENKVMFDAFGLPIFDLSVAKEAYDRAQKLGLGTQVAW